jgi:mono/diheme cytochrome c family protein
MRRFLAMASLAGLLLAAGPAAGSDIHQLWDRQCGGCHGHAGAFARQSLKVVDGVLRGRADGRDVSVLLRTHNGGYGPDDITAIYAMLLAQAQTPELFRVRCGECHPTAAQLVREQVVSRDGVLYGRYSGRRIAEYLPRHGKLDEADAALLLDVLERVEAEVHRP